MVGDSRRDDRLPVPHRRRRFGSELRPQLKPSAIRTDPARAVEPTYLVFTLLTTLASSFIQR